MGEENNACANGKKSEGGKKCPYTTGLPVDRGWAWIVLFASWLTMAICLGTYRTYGILFIELQRKFNSEASTTALVGSVCNTTYSVTSILVSVVGLQHLSHRTLVFTGGCFLALAFILTGFAPNVEFAIFSLGCLAGLGQGFLMIPTTALLTKYFNKNRSFATALSVSGGGVGGLIFSVLIRIFVNNFGFSGALLIIGGITLNVLVAACLMRPLSFYGETYKNRRCENVQHEDEISITERRPHKNGKIAENIISVECNNKTKVDINGCKESVVNLEQIKPLINNSNGNNRNLTNSKIEKCLPESKPSPFLSRSLKLKNARVRTVSEHSKFSLAHAMGSSLSISTTELCVSVSSMLDRSGKDGPIGNETAADKGDRESNTSDSQLNKCCPKLNFGVNCSVMKRPPLLLFLPCSFLLVTLSSIQVFLPPHAVDSGLSDTDSDSLISIISFIDIFALVAWGLFADRGFVKRFKIISLTSLIVAAATFCMPLIDTKTEFIVYSVVFGIFGRAFFGLYPVVLVDFLGIDNLGSALGVTGLVMPLCQAIEQPIIGLLRDSSSSYLSGFMLIACAVTAGGLLIWTLPLGAKCEKSLKKDDILV
ncbi:monocarboxylate transporter 3-like [Mya arenaria]|uniref:monocarboxylate transporter 3-like n=1 Tax=Mya arenaria TaxID=6604 RepID=UPI0022E4A11E|nr:monocarboxylate transporter 3-like [Mya arenaria]